MVIVRTACQNDLNDKRERNWEDEVILFLDENYEDWKNPSRTFMVPCEFTYKRSKQNDGEEAEKEFFYLLQKFGESRSEPMFVIHSHKFAEVVSDSELNEESTDVESADEESIDEESTEEKARFWLMGEHDFVVIHRKWGIMFFQVKAGSKLKKKYHAALDQVEKDKRSLQQYAAKNFLSQMRQALNSMLHKGAGFVVMPNCSYQSVRKAGQVKASSGIFKEDCENVDAFSEWWNDKVANVGRNIDQELFKMLVMHYVGMAHSFHCTLSGSIEDDGKALEMCTKKQLEVLLSMKSQQWISGPAGSGKTWLLIKKVLMLAKEALREKAEKKILVVCYNRPLSAMLSNTFADTQVVRVQTFESLLHEITGLRPAGSDEEKEERIAYVVESLKKNEVTWPVRRYDHIFVDECQDLCGDKWPILFELLWKGGGKVTNEIMWFLFDTNQYLRLSPQHPLWQRETLSLSKVLRNTKAIFNQSKKYFSSEEAITLGHNIRGLEIRWDYSLPPDVHNDASYIKKHVEDLKANKVPDKDICILTQNVDSRKSICAGLKENGIESQNAEELFEKGEDKVVVESIRRFKGLESKVVILYDPPYQIEGVTWRNPKGLLYTALSRCFCYLIIITNPEGYRILQS